MEHIMTSRADSGPRCWAALRRSYSLFLEWLSSQQTFHKVCDIDRTLWERRRGPRREEEVRYSVFPSLLPRIPL